MANIVELLLEENPDLKEIQSLIDVGVSVNSRRLVSGDTLLMIASGRSHEALALLLIKNGANLNDTNFNGDTALILGCQRMYPNGEKVAQILIDAGALVNFANNTRTTALIEASKSGMVNVIIQLIAKGSNVNHADRNGYTALMGASDGCHSLAVQTLLKAGGNVHAQNIFGGTALSFACEAGFLKQVKKDVVQIISLLVDAGSNVDCQDEDGITPIMKAIFKNNEDAVYRLLQEYPNLELHLKLGHTIFNFNTSKVIQKMLKQARYRKPVVSLHKKYRLYSF